MTAVEVCVLFTLAAGRGRARRRLETIRRVLGDRAEFRPTEGPGHAEGLAVESALAGCGPWALQRLGTSGVSNGAARMRADSLPSRSPETP